MQNLYQENLVKLQPKGLLTIPKKLRVELGLEESKLVRLRVERGRLIIDPVRTLPYPVRSYTSGELKEFINLDRNQTAELTQKGSI